MKNKVKLCLHKIKCIGSLPVFILGLRFLDYNKVEKRTPAKLHPILRCLITFFVVIYIVLSLLVLWALGKRETDIGELN